MAALTALALAGTAVSTGIAVYGQQQAAKSAEEAAEYNSQVAENEAGRRELENHETVRRQRSEKRRAMAQAKARLAANGAALGEGTAVDVMEVLDSRLETDIQDTARRAQLETRAMRQQASLQSYQAKQQATALRTASVGTLLSGATKVASGYSDFRYNSRKK